MEVKFANVSLSPNNYASIYNDNYDIDYDLSVNEFLDSIDINKLANSLIFDEDDECSSNEDLSDNCIDLTQEIEEDTSGDVCDPNEIVPDWYEDELDKKKEEALRRLECLSKTVSCACDQAQKYLFRLEQDHNNPFCRLDPVRHRPLNQIWNDSWIFDCVIEFRCNSNLLEHAHTKKCQHYVLTHVETKISTESKEILDFQFPEIIMKTVKEFQQFINTVDVAANKDGILTAVPRWASLQIKSSGEKLMLIVSGDNLTNAKGHLLKYFSPELCENLGIISIYCVHISWNGSKKNDVAKWDGQDLISQNIGKFKINYNPIKNVNWFDCLEIELLGKSISKYLPSISRCTLLLVGSSSIFGAIMAYRCDKVVGIFSEESEIKISEQICEENDIENAAFFLCQANKTENALSALLSEMECIVAVVKLDSAFGKSQEVMKALRSLHALYKIVMFGTYKEEFSNSIVELTKFSDGDPFLPKEGCIIDKSPRDHENFEMVISFERKSTIEIPKDVSIKDILETKKKPSIPKIKVENQLKSDASSDNEFISNIKFEITKDIKTEENKNDFVNVNPFCVAFHNNIMKLEKNEDCSSNSSMVKEELDVKLNPTADQKNEPISPKNEITYSDFKDIIINKTSVDKKNSTPLSNRNLLSKPDLKLSDSCLSSTPSPVNDLGLNLVTNDTYFYPTKSLNKVSEIEGNEKKLNENIYENSIKKEVDDQGKQELIKKLNHLERANEIKKEILIDKLMRLKQETSSSADDSDSDNKNSCKPIFTSRSFSSRSKQPFASKQRTRSPSTSSSLSRRFSNLSSRPLRETIQEKSNTKREPYMYSKVKPTFESGVQPKKSYSVWNPYTSFLERVTMSPPRKGRSSTSSSSTGSMRSSARYKKRSSRRERSRSSSRSSPHRSSRRRRSRSRSRSRRRHQLSRRRGRRFSSSPHSSPHRRSRRPRSRSRSRRRYQASRKKETRFSESSSRSDSRSRKSNSSSYNDKPLRSNNSATRRSLETSKTSEKASPDGKFVDTFSPITVSESLETISSADSSSVVSVENDNTPSRKIGCETKEVFYKAIVSNLDKIDEKCSAENSSVIEKKKSDSLEINFNEFDIKGRADEVHGTKEHPDEDIMQLDFKEIL